MYEFWQTYGNWIFFVVVIVLMFWMHGGHGHQHGMGALHRMNDGPDGADRYNQPPTGERSGGAVSSGGEATTPSAARSGHGGCH